jgi:DNA-binding MarR family transcriptional regulator
LPIERVAEMTDRNDAERLMSALRLVSTAEQRHAKAIARLSMSASDLDALSFIVDRGSPTTGDIARQLDLTSGAVAGVIDRLMKRGFVERVTDPLDRRKVVVRAVAAMVAPVSELFKPIESGMAELRLNRAVPRAGRRAGPGTR